MQSQLKRRLGKAVSELGLHYFLWHIQSTLAVKVFNNLDPGQALSNSESDPDLVDLPLKLGQKNHRILRV